ncbi:SOS response-associated peptidase family protein [Terrihabitans sp. PJ23]|uniref:Abasic site processing protein n=1 Tax=Terrihabitans rhizophilus TaxID=3092662 RepID=A0ABU4RQ09_9HYPH|nr:SOS response-associated peptidase family protein [Terrihabitans sp. PJ23]MDX6806933.1 SOS response-associated peptidase family protein [Terrihabitans sp. PJ23]
MEDDQRPRRDGRHRTCFPISIAEAPLHRTGRCILRVDRCERLKQPHAIAMKDRALFEFAGFWENWKPPATEQWLRTFTIITTRANETIADLHQRMLVVLKPDSYEQWLSPDAVARELLRSTRLTRWRTG